MSKASPEEIVSSVLTAVGIKVVISVDDNYNSLPDLADVSAKVQLMENEFLRQRLPDGLFSEDPATLADRLKRLWETKSDEDRVKLLVALGLQNRNDVETTDAIALSKMPSLFASFDFRALGLPEWRAKVDAIVEECKTARTLVLFDEDLHKQGGTNDEGLKLMKEIFARTSADDLMGCLVSHNYHLSTVQDDWKRFAADNSLPQDRFSLIPKELLKDKPIEFAALIKLSAVTKQYVELLSQARKIFTDCVSVANEHIVGLTLYDLDKIVFQSSDREGVWEPDTLFRLLGIFHRGEMRKMALPDATLRKASSEIRRISGVATPSLMKASPDLFRVQHVENYEDADQLNQLHRPTELGDIYEDIHTRRRYILIAPQCDLMVRTRLGFRGDKFDVLKDALLAQIVGEKPDEGLGWKLDFYSENDQFVDFKRTFVTRLIQLDLCVLNSDGSATFSGEADPATLLIPAWEKRSADITRYSNQLIAAYTGMDPREGQTEKVNDLLTRSNGDLPFPGTIDPAARRVQYNCKRVMRLLAPRSTALIGAYAKFLDRDAFEHTFD